MRRESTPLGFSGLFLQTAESSFFIGEPGGGPGEGSLVISNGSDPMAAVSGVPFEANRDYFLVARIRVGPGHDPATLWVNPTPGVQPTDPGVTCALGDFGSNLPTPQFLAGVGPGVVTHFDELRTGSSYADVAPAVPEPAGCVAIGAAMVLAGRRRPR